MNNEMKDRIREAAGLIGGLRRLSEKAEIVESTIAKWVAGTTEPKAQGMASVAKATGVSLDWLIAGQGPMRPNETNKRPIKSDYVSIQRYDLQLSAGNGSFINRAEMLDTIPFTRDFFEKRLHRNSEDMIIVDARGESMEPAMYDHDLVMIDTKSADRPIASAIYGFTFENQVFVKRLEVQPTCIIAHSDNKDYGDFIIDATMQDQFHPIGRVVWVGRML